MGNLGSDKGLAVIVGANKGIGLGVSVFFSPAGALLICWSGPRVTMHVPHLHGADQCVSYRSVSYCGETPHTHAFYCPMHMQILPNPGRLLIS